MLKSVSTMDSTYELPLQKIIHDGNLQYFIHGILAYAIIIDKQKKIDREDGYITNILRHHYNFQFGYNQVTCVSVHHN